MSASSIASADAGAAPATATATTTTLADGALALPRAEVAASATEGPADATPVPARALQAPVASRAPAPACLYLLADHLDAVLASGEDLLAVAVAARAPDAAAGLSAVARGEVREAVERIRTLELRMLARALKGRERAIELAAADDRFTRPARLFVGGTGALADAVDECADTSVADFETGDALPAYLRSRGLIDARQCRLPDEAALAIGEDFLVAGRIPLGALLDLVAAFLDALELHVDLYVDAPASTEPDAEAAAAA